MLETWITVDQAAQRLGKSRRTIYRWLASGRMRSRVAETGRREVLLTPPVVEVAPNLPTETLDEEPVQAARHPGDGAADGLDFLADTHVGLDRRIDEIAAASDMGQLQADLNAVELDRARRGWRRSRRVLWAAMALLALLGVGAQWYSLHRLRHVEQPSGGQALSAGTPAAKALGARGTDTQRIESSQALRAEVARLRDQVRQLRMGTTVAKTPWPPPATDPSVIDLPDIPAP